MTIPPSDIFNISDSKAFSKAALDIFQFQYIKNSTYKNYVDLLKIKPAQVTQTQDIPFLPIQLFKTQVVTSLRNKPAHFFESSGTGGDKSRHYYNSLKVYKESFMKCFELFYGNPADYSILALLPSYHDNTYSSLIFMVNELIKKSGRKHSGFYHKNEEALYQNILSLAQTNAPAILIGVSFALLGFCEKYTLKFPELIVIETGGMKGRRREIVREALHGYLCNGLGVNNIHSEYGMTELFSQAYSSGHGIFKCPPWLKVLTRDIDNPLSTSGFGKGALNIIDLANIHSCAFIATEDVGTVNPDGSFTVSGRMDNTQLRGCNLLI